ncbi:MAG: hypothetical protein FWH50_00520 [Coriobacteriia bacterium]|nr:hypothetical protein [Coriobacteriia bacterium]
MRRPSFSRWIKNQLMLLSGFSRFDLRKLAAAAQSSKPRLIEPLLLYARAANCTDRLLGLVWRDDVRKQYLDTLETIGASDLESLALFGLEAGLEKSPVIKQLPRDYVKFLRSFQVAYRQPEIKSQSKQLRWDRSRALQLEKGIGSSEICRDLGLNLGNVNAYLKYGALEKVSLEKATEIMKYLYSR